MSVLTGFGLLLDLMGAVFITLSDPLRFPSRILIARYWFDRHFGPVAFVKEGYQQVRAGDVYKSQETRLNEQTDPDPNSPQEALNNVNRLERTEVNPELVDRFYQIARLTEDGDSTLLRDEYRPPVMISNHLIPYKVTYTSRGGADFDGAAISFVHEPSDLRKSIHGDENYVYHVPVEDFRDKLSEYINGVYLRNGMYLLATGFVLQILDILLTTIVGWL